MSNTPTCFKCIIKHTDLQTQIFYQWSLWKWTKTKLRKHPQTNYSDTPFSGGVSDNYCDGWPPTSKSGSQRLVDSNKTPIKHPLLLVPETAIVDSDLQMSKSMLVYLNKTPTENSNKSLDVEQSRRINEHPWPSDESTSNHLKR